MFEFVGQTTSIKFWENDQKMYREVVSILYQRGFQNKMKDSENNNENMKKTDENQNMQYSMYFSKTTILIGVLKLAGWTKNGDFPNQWHSMLNR